MYVVHRDVSITLFMCVAPGVSEVTVGLIVNYLHFVYLVSCILEGILESDVL